MHFETSLDDLDSAGLEFTPFLWHVLLDYATVTPKGEMVFEFRDGTRISEAIEMAIIVSGVRYMILVWQENTRVRFFSAKVYLGH